MSSVDTLTSLTSRERSVWTVTLRSDRGICELVEPGIGRMERDTPT